VTLQRHVRVTILCAVDKRTDIWSLIEADQSAGADGICAAPGCDADAIHRAPLSRRALKSFIWLCLDHVREYNAAWDYYAGLNESQIEAHRRADATWRRPSWPFGTSGAFRMGGEGPEIRDDFGVYEDNIGTTNGSQNGSGAKSWEPETEEQKALAMLDLAPPVNADQVKTRYKELVKRLHPDANGGDKKAEERLKLINDAYSTLKRSEWLQAEPR
jgi:hypothetical protein